MKLIKLFTVCVSLFLMTSNSALAAEDHKGHNHDSKSAAHPHDAQAKHGGIVTVVQDINYELVAKPDSMTLYIYDHGQPVDVTGGSATLTLLSASGKTEAVLLPAGGNKLEAKGSFKLPAGTKASGNVTIGGKTVKNLKFKLN